LTWKTLVNVDYQLLLLCERDIHSSGMLRGVDWYYEAYSESKGRLVSKKNIFVRHIFYWRV